ncbi:MAG: hypothetical protein WD176_00015, partial [Pirellulales bacterium]
MPVSRLRFALLLGTLVFLALAGGPQSAFAQRRRCCPPAYDCPAPHVAPAPAAPAETPPSAEVPEPASEEEPFIPESRFAALSSDDVSVPNMLGDFPGGPCLMFWTQDPLTPPTSGVQLDERMPLMVCFPTFLGRTNLAENNSPMPRDRAFFRYEHFHNTTSAEIFGQPSSFSVDRFLVGLERTFLDGMISFDVRMPFASQLSSDLVVTQQPGFSNLPIDQTELELGNLGVIGKVLLVGRPNWGLSAGLAITAPTAEATRIRMRVDGQMPGGSSQNVENELTVDNESANLTPFIAVMFAPEGALFFNGFVQFDVPTGDQAISIRQSAASFSAGNQLTDLGTVRGELDQQSLLRMNMAGGMWIYRDATGTSTLQALAALVELHYTTSIENAETWTGDVVLSDSGQVPGQIDPGDETLALSLGNPNETFELVNLTLGAHAEFGRSNVAVGVVFPLSTGADR